MAVINLDQIKSTSRTRALIRAHKAGIRRHEARIREIQARCPHADVTVTPGSSTGNYDPSEDDYWYTIVCDDCDHMFTVYNSKNPEEYRHWARRK